MKKLFSLFIVVITVLLVFPAMVAADSGQYSKMLDSPDVQTRIQATKLMIRDKVLDNSLLKKVKTKLLAGYKTRTRDRFHYDEMAYYCKAFAATGDTQYIDLLKMVENETPNSNLKRHAITSQKLLADNAELNKIAGSREGWDKSLTDEENRQLQMLRSDQFRLKRTAARNIYDNPGTKSVLYDEIATQLLAGLEGNNNDRDYMDTMAWLCKALGRSGQASYKETLNKVKAGTKNKKLRKYADQALKML